MLFNYNKEMKLLRQNKLKTVMWVAIAIVIVFLVYLYWEYRKLFPSTDNAYIGANIVQVAPQITGPIQKIYVNNFDEVKKGQALFDIDPATFKVALDRATSNLEIAKQSIYAQKKEILSEKAQVQQKESELILAEQTNRRIQELVKRKQLAAVEGDKATRDVKVAKAASLAASEQLHETIEKLGDPDLEDNAEVGAAEAEVARAKLNLDYTHITSPTDGYIVNLTGREGTMVQSGVALFSIVDSHQWWVDANFKETELERIRPGQLAEIVVDIYPDHVFHGYVQNISPGSGAAFSIFPAENATGNWVKVTQRFSVRIYITDPDLAYPLRIGASSNVTINTRKFYQPKMEFDSTNGSKRAIR